MSDTPDTPPAASNPSLATSAYMVSSADKSYSPDSDDEIASLPSESASESDLDTLSDGFSDAEEEWRESMEQLELLLTMVLVPFVGKYLGRKTAYWSMCPVLPPSPFLQAFQVGWMSGLGEDVG